jgi:predicted phosphodiesterase
VSLERILFVPDTHRPYHDKKLWRLLLRAGRELRPDTVVTLGDFADFYSVSSHDKNPNRAADLQYEVDDVRVGLKDLMSLGATKHIYVSGNHEDRLERYLMQKAPALFNSVKLDEVLGLKDLGWRYVPYKQHILLGKLHITHDTGNAGQYAHYRAQETFQGNCIIGHTHRMGYAVVGNAAGNPHVAAMFGWLGDLTQIDYLHKVSAMRHWAHGFGIGYKQPNGNVLLTPVPIVEGACIIEGKLVR